MSIIKPPFSDDAPVLPKKTKKEPSLLNGIPDKGRVKVLKAILYKSHMIYVRMIGTDYFEYLLEYKGEIYSSYIIIKPRGNHSKLSQSEIGECMALIYTGAEATLDQLLGVKVDEKTKQIVETFEQSREKVEGKDKDAPSVQ